MPVSAVDQATRHDSPYAAALGPAFGALHAHVRRAHLAPLRATGHVDVEHGSGWSARLLIWLMSLPAAGPGQPVDLTVATDGSALVWTRCIGASVLRTRQHASGSRLVERAGPGRIDFRLAVQDGALVYRQAAIYVAGVRWPRPLSPRVDALVSGIADGWHVSVTVTWRGRTVCRYGGDIQPS